MGTVNDLNKWSDYQIWQFTLCPVSKARTARGATNRKWHREIEAEAIRRNVRSKYGLTAKNPTQ